MSRILIPSYTRLNEKVSAIQSDGIDNLHIQADFDRTLTKARGENEKMVVSSWGMLVNENISGLHPEYPDKAKELFREYYPIEKDLSLDFEYRYQKIEEWFNKQFDLVIESKLHLDVIANGVRSNPNILREGVEDFFNFLNSLQIPLVVNSAGLGNVIEHYLREKSILHPNVFILSNIISFCQNGYAISFQEQTIHSLNKGQIQVKNPDYHELTKDRPNVVLLGDSIGDVDMTKNMDTKTVLKVGFLNSDIEKNLDIYSEHYDILILNDGSMMIVNSIIETICNSRSKILFHS